MDFDLSTMQDAAKYGWLAVGAVIVRALIVRYRPKLQAVVASEWPSAWWAGWLLTATAAAVVAALGAIGTGAGLDWVLMQTALNAFFSIATTPGMDARTSEMQIFVKNLSKLPTPVTTVDQGGGSLDGPSQPAGPVDPPADAGPT